MNERGGAIYGFLAAIGVVVLLLALFFAGCFANAGAVPVRRPCDRRYEECDQNHRGNFSPGPFDRSPVDVHDNDICVSVDCSGYGSTTTTRSAIR